tara:strand:- start:122 stop:544 length:423 start_codon:yes stop_codon:yes gene_type:complete
MGNIREIQKEILEEFEMFDSWVQKYEYLIELGKELPKLEKTHKIDSNLIKGCQSKVWLHAKKSNKKIFFFADSDAIMTKGIISLLIRVLSNQDAKEIIESDLSFIDKIGLKEQLSATRANGLVAMIKQMKIYALAFSNNI